ncbi:MAG: hypothetical protein ACE5Q6_20495, partial [Dehalococcoidia bacterium]
MKLLVIIVSLAVFMGLNPTYVLANHGRETGDLVEDEIPTAVTIPEFTPFENCTGNVLNRTIQTSRFGAFTLFNVPADEGLLRVRVTCTQDGTTLGGQSGFVVPVAGDTTTVEQVVLGVVDPIPASIAISASQTALTSAGEGTQLTVTGTF